MIYETGFNIEVAEAGPCPITVEILDPEVQFVWRAGFVPVEED